MSDQSAEILTRIVALEEELERRLETQRRLFRYTIERERVKFEAAARERHKELRTGLVRFVLNSGALEIVAAIVIYLQIVPLLLVDLAISVFQAVCFPIYGIAKVARADYIVFDRHHLAYLNLIEKLNCVYCGYANGLLAYGREIAGRTEAHFCPIKHARVTRGQHRAYYGFADYGDAEGFRAKEAEATARADAERRKTVDKSGA
jgi:hypothetical protein